MTITATCSCTAQIQAPDELAGRSVKCPKCKSAIAIPPAGGGQPGDNGNPQTSGLGNMGSGGHTQAPNSPGTGYGGNRANAYSRPQDVSTGYAGGQASSQGSARGATGQSPRRMVREDGDIPQDLRERVESELGDNEHIVWLGKPIPALILLRNCQGFIIGTVIIIAVLALYLSSPTSGNTGTAILGVLIGCLFLIMPILKWKTATRTCYALTNRRAIVLTQGLSKVSRDVYSPAEVAKMHRTNWFLFNGGDLVFTSVTVVKTTYDRGGMNRSVDRKLYGFIAIEKAEEVEMIVRETLIDPFIDKINSANSF